MSSTELRTVISKHSLLVLRQRGDDAPRLGGFRTISQSSCSSSVSSTSTLNVPELLDSLESLQFLQFRDDIAASMFAHFSTLNEERPHCIGLRGITEDQVRRTSEDAINGEDYAPILEKIGFTPFAVQKLSHPNLQEFRQRFSAKDFAMLSLESGWGFLENFDKFVLPPTAAIGFAKSSSSWMSGPTIRHSLEVMPPSRSSSVGKPLPPGGNLRAGPYVASTSIPPPPKSLPTHTILLKGGLWTRLSQVFVSDGGLDFGTIISSTRGDFSKRSEELYFTTDYETAAEYAKFRAAAHGDKREQAAVGILALAVPNEIFKSQYWIVGKEWNDYVWYCRSREAGMDDEPFEYLEGFSWLCGGVCMVCNDAIDRGSETKESIKVQRKDGNVPTQYMGRVKEVRKRLNQQCRGQTWLTSLN